MSQISDRLRASVRFDAINGDAMERSVCGRQMIEAANTIDRLQSCRDELEAVTRAANDSRINNSITLEEWVRKYRTETLREVLDVIDALPYPWEYPDLHDEEAFEAVYNQIKDRIEEKIEESENRSN